MKNLQGISKREDVIEDLTLKSAIVWREDTDAEEGYKFGITESSDPDPSTHMPPNVSRFADGKAYGLPLGAVDVVDNLPVTAKGESLEWVEVKPWRKVQIPKGKTAMDVLNELHDHDPE